MKLLVTLAIALVPCSAYAAPVYLSCQLDQGAKGGVGGEDFATKAPMKVTLNEDAGTVTYAFPDMGRAFTTRGVFTADKVQFNSFTVDRTDFSFQRVSLGVVDRGRCTLVEVKRAF